MDKDIIKTAFCWRIPMKKKEALPPTLVTIAGFDPSGGAGVSLDLRVFEGLGFAGGAVATAVTAQNSSRVAGIFDLPARAVRAQFDSLEEDIRLAGIKVGMLGSRANMRAVAGILAHHPDVPRVVDPVFRSSSGAALLDPAGIDSFLSVLRGHAALITPNLDEASALTGVPVRDVGRMKAAAFGIFEASGIPCLVKGGRLRGRVVDVLYDGHEHSLFIHAVLKEGVHGTGCCLSSAALGYLARGHDLVEACRLAIEFVHDARKQAVRKGRGRRTFSFPPRQS
jgi:hydroxymethylpyrimidine/phosphomethylpyrimidine kinase